MVTARRDQNWKNSSKRFKQEFFVEELSYYVT
jgi:hypothetical protein